jgi:hypothetical protein
MRSNWSFLGHGRLLSAPRSPRGCHRTRGSGPSCVHFPKHSSIVAGGNARDASDRALRYDDDIGRVLPTPRGSRSSISPPPRPASATHQFSAFTASVCCISIGRHRRRLLWVGGLRKRLAGGAVFLPVNPQLRTSSGAQANFRLSAAQQPPWSTLAQAGRCRARLLRALYGSEISAVRAEAGPPNLKHRFGVRDRPREPLRNARHYPLHIIDEFGEF